MGFSDEEKSLQYTQNSRRISVLKGASSEGLASAFGTYVLAGEIYFGLKTSHETTSVCSASVLEQAPAVRQNLDPNISFVDARLNVVEFSREIEQGHFHPTKEPEPKTVIRRLSGGLGSNDRGHVLFRQLDGSRKTLTYKQPGTEGYMERPESSRGTSEQQDGGCSSGQYNSSGIYNKTRGHQVMGVVFSSERDPRLVRIKECGANPSIHQRSEKLDSRCPESEESDCADRMDTELGSLPFVVENLGSTVNRSVCDKAESQVAELYVASPRRASGGGRRHVALMVQHGRLCVPSICHDSSGHKQVQTIDPLQNDPCSSMVAPTGVVPRSSGTVGGRTTTIATQTRSPKPASGEAASSKPPHSSSDRLATVIRFGRAKHLSEEVSRTIFGARKASTNKLYQYRWSIYFNWCKKHNYSASRPSVNSLCEFFIS